MNRKGAWDTFVGVSIAVLVVVFISWVIWGNPFSTPGSFLPPDQQGPTIPSIWDGAQETVSFETLFGNVRAKPLDYIFGGVPQYLVDTTSEQSAAIIMIGIWFLFLLTFADILTVFGFFSKYVAWLSAVILVVLAANLKFISVISVGLLFVTSFLGVLSVLASIASVFIMFLVFHWGSHQLKERMILRRAQDQAIRAVAGGRKAASGISVLKDIVAASEKGEKS